jgi:hypothetical protein
MMSDDESDPVTPIYTRPKNGAIFKQQNKILDGLGFNLTTFEEIRKFGVTKI